MNRFEASTLDAIRRREDGVRDARVLVACSGGGDSAALLIFLWMVRRSLGLELVVAHADHGLRPEAPKDAAFVQELCRRLDLDLVEARLDVNTHAGDQGLGVETAARELRWAWLKAEAASMGAAVVATGHTLDDHTETILIRLGRGGGLGSITPLPARQGLRWSPLIEARRANLRAYLRQKEVPWREDASNEEGFTPRNRWRKLLEEMRREAPALDTHLWETHTQAAELKAWRDTQVASWRGARWEAQEGLLLLKGPFSELELRWSLEAAFRELNWCREAERLRGLSAWALQFLGRKARKPKQWGEWALCPREGTFPWSLAPATPTKDRLSAS